MGDPDVVEGVGGVVPDGAVEEVDESLAWAGEDGGLDADHLFGDFGGGGGEGFFGFGDED